MFDKSPTYVSKEVKVCKKLRCLKCNVLVHFYSMFLNGVFYNILQHNLLRNIFLLFSVMKMKKFVLSEMAIKKNLTDIDNFT